MSHFSVLVITDDGREDQVAEALAPFEEELDDNPKWDWWQIGGRWTGAFAEPGYEPSKDPRNQEVCTLCHGTGKRTDMEVANGCNSCHGTGTAVKWPTEWVDHGNVIQVKDIPWEAMTEQAVKEALESYDKAKAAVGDFELPPPWAPGDNIDAAREAYWAYPSVKALREVGYFDVEPIIQKLKRPREEVAEAAKQKGITCFAILYDGNWTEAGEMGWFGSVANEKPEVEWDAQVTQFLKNLPGDKFITVVDCHV